MSKEAMKLALEHAKRDERHLNHAETRYWCRMYRDIAEKAVEALAKPDFWEGYVPEPVKPAQQEYASFAEWAHDYVQDNLHKLKPAQQALDKKAENARELGLDYEPVCNKDPQGCWNVRCQLGKKCKNTPAQQEPVACECHRCIDEKGLNVNGLPLSMTKMILCPKCGNKRCPKASDHRLTCTNSNDPGQPGSIYTSPPAQRTWVGLTDEEIEKLITDAGFTRSDLLMMGACIDQIARLVEAKLRSKNEDRN
jgi:hypothetical protein